MEKDNKKPLPKRFLHVCEVCGKTEILSPEEAFEAGWDYPPKMGTFGIMSPRTCGDCPITETVYWKIVMSKGKEPKLTEKDLETIKRIANEPESLIVPENLN